MNEKGHLTIGGLDTVDLAKEYGTPIYVMDEGPGLDVVSEGELYTATSIGFPMEKVCFHGNNKTDWKRARARTGYAQSSKKLLHLKKMNEQFGRYARLLKIIG